jgi:hypothetical protein
MVDTSPFHLLITNMNIYKTYIPLRRFVKEYLKTALFLTFTLLAGIKLSIAQTDQAFQIPFEVDSNRTVTYQELISYYKQLSNAFPSIRLTQMGRTDVGKPLHLAIIDGRQEFRPPTDNDDRLCILINNGIHPGESCGIDASILYLRKILSDEKYSGLLKDVILLVIPSYNVGGMLNRSATSRANQEGPAEYGFRANALNLDLNRDFIKCDSRNAQGFSKLFASWNPDVIIDTHTSNGADYPYTMTLLSNLRDRMSRPLGDFLYEEFMPKLFEGMKALDDEMVPYVQSKGSPEHGILAFDDKPRYASGFALLHQSIGFTTEAHMLKPYKERVKSTYNIIRTIVQEAANDRKAIQKARKQSVEWYNELVNVPLDWAVDTLEVSSLLFKGFAARHKKSVVTGHECLYYDRQDTYEREIPYLNKFKTIKQVRRPSHYVIPQAYESVCKRLRWNGVKMQRLQRDSLFMLDMYYITNYITTDFPYEGHYLHYAVSTRDVKRTKQYYRGDWLVSTDQEKSKLIMETLEPAAPDSYFAWNFFDGTLMRKEYFSPYIFEETAASMLAKDDELRAVFEQKRRQDSGFMNNPYEQLKYLYERSPHFEDTYKLYPIGRIFE